MARLDLDDLPPRIANLLLGLDEGAELLIVQHGGLLRRMIVQSYAPAVGTPPPAAEAAPEPSPEPTAAARVEATIKRMRSPVPAPDQAAEAKPPEAKPEKPEPLPPPPISSPAVEQKTRDIFESLRSAIEEEP